jgi:hypothetical protein
MTEANLTRRLFMDFDSPALFLAEYRCRIGDPDRSVRGSCGCTEVLPLLNNNSSIRMVTITNQAARLFTKFNGTSLLRAVQGSRTDHRRRLVRGRGRVAASQQQTGENHQSLQDTISLKSLRENFPRALPGTMLIM